VKNKMTMSVELKVTGDIWTPEHRDVIKRMMDAIDKEVNASPSISYKITPYRSESVTAFMSRPLVGGSVSGEPFSATHTPNEVRMSFGLHLNPVKPESVVDSPNKQV
jgi:hypothetical protein